MALLLSFQTLATPALYISELALCYEIQGQKLLPESQVSLSWEHVKKQLQRITGAVNIPLLLELSPYTDQPEWSQLSADLKELQVSAVILSQPLKKIQGKDTFDSLADDLQQLKELCGSEILLTARLPWLKQDTLEMVLDRAELLERAGAAAFLLGPFPSFAHYKDFAQQYDSILLAEVDEYATESLLTAEELAELGYQAAVYPNLIDRLAWKSTEAALLLLEEDGSQHELLDIMPQRQEWNESSG